MGPGLDAVLLAVAGPLYAYWLYQMAIAVWGFRAPAPLAEARTACRFAVVVPAHDEAPVIGKLLDSLRGQRYPRDRHEVYVACDACTDGTPGIARAAGARVLAREGAGPAGKPRILAWALDRIPLDAYDAVVVFDADNLVRDDFLARMNDYLEAHPAVAAVQGYLDVKNPDDSWVTRVYALAFWYANRFWQVARANLGLAVNLGGTGEVVRVAALREVGWQWQSLAEDLELTCRLVLAGRPVGYHPAAVAYDEKPVTLRASRVQRSRWLAGHYWVFGRYAAPLLAAFLRTGRLRYLDLLLHLAIPGRAAMSYATMFGGWAVVLIRVLAGATPLREDPRWGLWAAVAGAAAVQCGLVLVVAPSLRHRRLTLRYLPDLLSFLAYGLGWLPGLLRSLPRAGRRAEWQRTEHTRALDLDDVPRGRGEPP